MAGNRRHAGGVSSAQANLKRIDAEIAAGLAARVALVPWPTNRLIGYAKNYLGRGNVALARGLLDEAAAAERRAAAGLQDGGLARARDLALASLRASLGEDHPDYVLITTTPAIGKDEALKKYERLMDRNLTEPVTVEDQRRAAQVGKPAEARSIAQSRVLAQVASARELQEFALQVGGFSWPATYGSSPWERAFSLASQLGFVSGVKPMDERETRTSWHAFDVACVNAYREERQRMEGMRVGETPTRDLHTRGTGAATEGVPAAGPPTLYIYRADNGESAGQVIDSDGKALSGIAGCRDENEVISAATEQGYVCLGIARVARLEDIRGFGGRPAEPEGVLRHVGSSSRPRRKPPVQGQER